MDFGVIFLSHVESYQDAAFAESKGFTHAWFGDSQMVWADVYQCMALCATKTTTIKLGTNVTNPSSRIAPVTACNFATLNVLAPGRVIMGIGTGNTSCAEFKPEHAPLVTERMIKETTLTGTPEEIRTRIRKMQAMGVKQVAVAGGGV